VVAVAVFLLFSAACGHRATRADCQLIVAKSVELQMKEMRETDPGAIAKKQRDVEVELTAQLSSCEQRRVSERTIACVQTASVKAELETCLK
jgi:hypothetical protein